MNQGPTPLDVALRLRNCGISTIPLRCDGSKSPAILGKTGKWEEFQIEPMSVEEIHRQFGGRIQEIGLGIIAGKVSGNLEIIDIEGRAPVQDIFDLIEEHQPGLISKLTIIATPSGGRHLFYRCAQIARNQPLARKLCPSEKENAQPGDMELKVLIETRAEGGYVASYSSPGSCHKTGKLYTIEQRRLTEIPEITPEERNILLSCCRSFNQYVETKDIIGVRPRPTPKPGESLPLRPGDDYNLRGNPLSVLEKHGWTPVRQHGDAIYLRRPGKDAHGISASLGHVAPNVLYVFSTNAFPFESNRAYDAFGVVLTLDHAGDTKAATKGLAADGYGEKKRPVEKKASAVLQEPVHEGADGTHRPVLDGGNTLQALAQLTNPTEDAVAALFEHAYKDTSRFCKEWGTWLEWDSYHWSTETTDLALDRSRRLARMVNMEEAKSPAKASFARGVESLARASRTFATRPDQWDQNHATFNTTGGTINLFTGESRPCTPSDYITKVCRIVPVRGSHPIFDRFMRDICLEDEALVSYHQKALGSMLSGALTDHWIIFWIGAGRNGKNTLGDLMVWLMGSYAKVISSETLLSSMSGSKHPTDLASLRGIRLAVSSEVPEGAHWDEARIKNVTGDEEISARFMGRDFFTFKRTHKHLVFGNTRPMLRVVDDAIKARLHIVPFNAKFTDDACDPDMASKLRSEAPQILQWLIDGHELWLEDGTLRRCSSVQAETDQYFKDQSTPEMWVEECCLTGPDYINYETSAGDLYKSFRAWKLARGEKAFSKTRWGQWMTPRFAKHLNNGVIYDAIRLNPATQPEESKRNSYYEEN